MIFDKFREPVFTKKGSELERKLKVLEELKKEYPDNEDLNEEYWMVKQGLKGEKEIEYELKDADIGMYVLHDITIQINDSKAQIDYILITPAHVYLVECKNLVGDIILDAKGEFRREYWVGNKRIKKSMYSPIRQAVKHKEILKKIWRNSHNGIFARFLESDFDWYYKILVVMAKAEGKLETDYAPIKFQNIVIRSDYLVEYLKKDIERTNRFDLMSPNQMKDFSDKFLMMTVQDNRDYKKEYIEKFNLKEQVENVDVTEIAEESVSKEDIKAKLLEYRVKKSKERRIPAYYIFNNQELENLLRYMPKSIDEMKETGMLAAVKIKFHGEEIIKIINNLGE